MKILAYTDVYASETVTFITNELKAIDSLHNLKMVYSKRINPDRYHLKNMTAIPYSWSRIGTKLRWWLEQSELFFWLKNARFKKGINKIIDEFKPDLIHCHFGTDFLKVSANLEKRHRHIPVLISFYGFDVTERIRNKAVLKMYRKFMSKKNVYSCAVSSNLVINIQQAIQPANAPDLLFSGIDTDFFKRKSIFPSGKEFVFLQVSSFYPKKGHRYSLEAFRKFIDQDKRFTYRYVIAGFGPLEQEIKDMIKNLGLESRVTLLGSQTPAQLCTLAEKCNCFLLHSISADNGDQEGLPNVLLEIMSLEIPIISTWHAGIPHIIEDKVNGLLVKEKDMDAYVSAMKQIVDWGSCPQNRAKMVEHFSMRTHMTKLEQIYQAMITQ